jgi:pyridinium-3,5-biscarboxylic acid mononucleotide synthase
MRPFDDLRSELEGDGDGLIDQSVRSDHGRVGRTGTPEVIYAARKSIGQVMAGIDSLIGSRGRVVVSQIPPGMVQELREGLSAKQSVAFAPGERSAVVALPGCEPTHTGGRVAVISAGTSDIPVAAEAALIAAEMGCDVHTAWDVGVAGIHRLVRPLETMIGWDADCFVVAAGMDGILPTVVCGLVAQPVIGLPISTGYGFGGEGVGALTTMLQSCSPGLSVVNIDNGIGAGITAARIANIAARARAARSTQE